jgi:pilus assembly protein Flp/PilA
LHGHFAGQLNRTGDNSHVGRPAPEMQGATATDQGADDIPGGKSHMNLFRLVAKWQSRTVDDEGATAVEYGLLVAGIAVVIIVAVGLFGARLTDIFNALVTKFSIPA